MTEGQRAKGKGQRLSQRLKGQRCKVEGAAHVDAQCFGVRDRRRYLRVVNRRCAACASAACAAGSGRAANSLRAHGKRSSWPSVHRPARRDAARARRKTGPDRLLAPFARSRQADWQPWQGRAQFCAAVQRSGTTCAAVQPEPHGRPGGRLRPRRHPASQRQRPSVRDLAHAEAARDDLFLQHAPVGIDRREPPTSGESRTSLLRPRHRALG